MALLDPEQLQAFSRKRLGLTSEAEVGRRRLGEDYDITSHQLSDQRDQGILDTGHQIASQGLFNSGIRINEQGHVVKNYNDSMASLNLDKTRGLEDVDRNLARGQADLDAQQASALAEANRQEQSQNDYRAQLEAIQKAQSVQAPQYPNPVIQIQQPAPVQNPFTAFGASIGLGLQNPRPKATQQVGAVGMSNGQLPQYNPPERGGSYQNWPSFVQKNPALANLYMSMNGGNESLALQKAQQDGYILGSTNRPGGRI